MTKAENALSVASANSLSLSAAKTELSTEIQQVSQKAVEAGLKTILPQPKDFSSDIEELKRRLVVLETKPSEVHDAPKEQPKDVDKLTAEFSSHASSTTAQVGLIIGYSLTHRTSCVTLMLIENFLKLMLEKSPIIA